MVVTDNMVVRSTSCGPDATLKCVRGGTRVAKRVSSLSAEAEGIYGPAELFHLWCSEGYASIPANYLRHDCEVVRRNLHLTVPSRPLRGRVGLTLTRWPRLKARP